MTKRLSGLPNLPFAPFVAALFGVVAVILILNTPSWMLEKLVNAIGLATILPAAAPPLGDTARTLLAVITGILVALPLWLVMRLIEGEVHKSRVAKARGSSINAADDVPFEGRRRSPIRAGAELGAPLMSEEALNNGGELLLSEPTAFEESPTPTREPMRGLQEETLLDLGSWKHEPVPTVDVPLAASVPDARYAVSEDKTAEASQIFPPISWDEAEAKPPAVALPWETTNAFESSDRDARTLDPFNLAVSNLPSAVEQEGPRSESIPAPSPARFEPVTFETVPVEQLTGIVPAPSAPTNPAARPADILDSAAFLKPDILRDGFREPTQDTFAQDTFVQDTARGLSIEGFLPERALEKPVAAPNWPEPDVADLAAKQEAPSPVSFETVPAWLDDAPIDAAPATEFAPFEPSESEFEAIAASSPAAPTAGHEQHDDDASLFKLLDRLETALARRATESTLSAPANLAALREILSESQSASNSPRAAGGSW